MKNIPTGGPFDQHSSGGGGRAGGLRLLATSERVKRERVKLERLERRALLAAIPLGSEFRTNQFTTGFQADPAVALDADGEAVVTWYSYGQDGDGRGIYARRYAPDGTPQGDEFLVNTHTTGSQSNPAVANDSDGDFVIVWQSENQDGGGWGVYGQRYNSAGVPQGTEFLVNTTTTGNQQAPAVAMDLDGDFVVVFEQDGTGPGIYGRRFSAAGVPQGDQFLVNSVTTSIQFAPAVSMASGGAFVVAWGSGLNNRDVLMRRYDAAGAPLAAEQIVNTFTTGEQYYPSVAVAASGDFIVAWDSRDQDGSGWGVYAQRFDASGVKQGDELRANEYTTDYQQNAAVAIDDDGNFVVTWTSAADQNGTGYGIYARQYNAAGAAQGGEFRVNTYTPNVQQYPAIANDSGGNFLIAWESFGQDGSAFGVYAQRFAPALLVTQSDFRFLAAPHQLRFTFNADVSGSLGITDLVVRNLTTNQTLPANDFTLAYDTSTNTATFTYTGPGGGPAGTFEDGNYTATLLAAGVTTPDGTPLPQDHVFAFFFLRGDANRDGRVNLIDFNRLANNFGQSPRDFTQGDFNYDSVVNLIDFNLLANRFGQMLFAPATSSTSTSFGSTRIEDDREDPLDGLMD